MLSSLILSHHRVALSGSGLSICEDADVVAFEGVFKHLNAEVFVNALLCGVLGVARLKDGKYKNIDNQIIMLYSITATNTLTSQQVLKSYDRRNVSNEENASLMNDVTGWEERS